MKNLSIGKKLTLGFGAIFMLLLLSFVAFEAAGSLFGGNVAYIAFAGALAIAAVLSILIVAAIGRSILAPVRDIERVYREIAKGNLRAKLEYDSRDELGNLERVIQQSMDMQNNLVQDVIDKFTRISRGDMQWQIDLDYPGDYQQLKQAIENTAAGLNQTLSSIHTAAEQVATGADQVSSGAQELAAGSTEQASAIEQLNESITRVADQANDNSINVQVATQYVEEASTGVGAGNEHMAQLNNAMENIDESSRQIANITKVIEDIAFQTNILALNAAIEAASAGSAGKGFAVVADEVRNLAAKSAEAAQQTGELIERSTATVAEGTQIAATTADILREVLEKAQQASESIVKIEEASSDQAIAIEEIRNGLTQVSSVVQTNAATAEENSATSEEMSAQAIALRQAVARFRLSDKQDDARTAHGGFEDMAVSSIAAFESTADFAKY